MQDDVDDGNGPSVSSRMIEQVLPSDLLDERPREVRPQFGQDGPGPFGRHPEPGQGDDGVEPSVAYP